MSAPLPTVARFAVSSDVPPRITEALRLGEKLRSYALSQQAACVERGEISEVLPVFVGRDDHGPLRGHDHLHVLLEPNASHGRISHVTFYARMGFEDAARKVLLGMRQVWRRRGHHLQLVHLGFGQPDDFGGLRYDEGQSPILACAKRWVSITPFVATRHLARSEMRDPARFSEAMRAEVLRLLRAQGIDEAPVRVGIESSARLSRACLPWRTFVTRRVRGEGRRGNVPPIGLQLEFAAPVRGPISLGYGAHFGLGLLAPAESFAAAHSALEDAKRSPLSTHDD